MRIAFKDGSFQYEILGKDVSVLEFHDPVNALNFLRRSDLDSTKLADLRRQFAIDSPHTHRMNREEFLEWLSHLLVNRRLTILRSFGSMAGRNGAEEEKAGHSDTDASKGAPRKKSWIEIRLRDAEGHPIPRERYRIKLPDGSVEEGTLDAFGYAEYYEINPGSCEVSFPDLDAGEWERA